MNTEDFTEGFIGETEIVFISHILENFTKKKSHFRLISFPKSFIWPLVAKLVSLSLTLGKPYL